MSAFIRLAAGPETLPAPEPPLRRGVWAWLREFRRRLRTRRLLAGFDDTLLRDIGVTRADAQQEAAKPFWRA